MKADASRALLSQADGLGHETRAEGGDGRSADEAEVGEQVEATVTGQVGAVRLAELGGGGDGLTGETGVRGSGSGALVIQRPCRAAGGAGESKTCCSFMVSSGGVLIFGSVRWE